MFHSRANKMKGFDAVFLALILFWCWQQNSAIASDQSKIADSGCKPVFDASDRIFAGPTHVFMTQSGGASETIFLDGSIYIMLKGQWKTSPMTIKQMQQQDQENRKTANYQCRYLHDEAVNGEPAAVYSEHGENPGAIKSDGQVWISKSKGLILRQEEDIVEEVDGGGKRHMSMRYEYTNVQKPKM